MKNIIFALVAVVVAIALAWLIWLVTPNEHYKVYDCSLAEFHPDYPPAVREECRMIRSEQKNFV